MLNQEFIQAGFRVIQPQYYIDNKNISSLHDLKKLYDLELKEDENGFRKRAYLKIQWVKKTQTLKIPRNQIYYQTAHANKADGGKIRLFKTMDKKILDIPIVNAIVMKNLDLIKDYPPLQHENSLTIGLHFIRYEASENTASYSSPDWLHKDDEPLVFVHLVNLSKTALGGDNLIADTAQKIKHVIRLENEIETLVLNKNVYHAVTPLGSKQGIALRDVILFTVEPDDTQHNEVELTKGVEHVCKNNSISKFAVL